MAENRFINPVLNFANEQDNKGYTVPQFEVYQPPERKPVTFEPSTIPKPSQSGGGSSIPGINTPTVAPEAEAYTPPDLTGNLLPDEATSSVFLQRSLDYGVPANVLMAMAQQESNYSANAVGVDTPNGRAIGIMQYDPAMANTLGIDPLDPDQAISAAAMQFKTRMEHGYTLEEAIIAHKFGDDRSKWGPKSNNYLQDIWAKSGAIYEQGESIRNPAQPVTPEAQPQQQRNSLYNLDQPVDMGTYSADWANMDVKQAEPKTAVSGRESAVTDKPFAQQDPGLLPLDQVSLSPEKAGARFNELGQKQQEVQASFDTLSTGIKTQRESLDAEMQNIKALGAELSQAKDSLTTQAAVDEHNKKVNQYNELLNGYQAKETEFQKSYEAYTAETEKLKDMSRMYDEEANAIQDQLGKNVRAKETQRENNGAGIFSDVVNMLNIGVDRMGLNFREGVRQVFGNDVVNAIDKVDKFVNGKSSEELLNWKIEHWEDQLSSEMFNARKKDWVTEDDSGYGFGPAWGDWRSYASGVVESLPETAATMLPAGALAKAAYFSAIARGAGTKVAAKSAAYTATVAGGLMEGFMGGGATANEIRNRIGQMTEEDFANSDAMKALMADGMSFEQAKQNITDNAASQAFVMAGIMTGIFGGQGDRVLSNIFSGQVSSRMKSTMKSALAEGLLEEAPQSFFQSIAGNVAMQGADSTVPLMEGTLNETAAGTVAGGIMGGGMGAAASVPKSREQQAKDMLNYFVESSKFKQSADSVARDSLKPDWDLIDSTLPDARLDGRVSQPQGEAPSGAIGRAATEAMQDEVISEVKGESVTVVSDEGTATPGTIIDYKEDGQGSFQATVENEAGQKAVITENSPAKVIRNSAIGEPVDYGDLDADLNSAIESGDVAQIDQQGNLVQPEVSQQRQTDEGMPIPEEFDSLFDEEGRSKFPQSQDVKDFKEQTGLGHDGYRAITNSIIDGSPISIEQARKIENDQLEERAKSLKESQNSDKDPVAERLIKEQQERTKYMNETGTIEPGVYRDKDLGLEYQVLEGGFVELKDPQGEWAPYGSIESQKADQNGVAFASYIRDGIVEKLEDKPKATIQPADDAKKSTVSTPGGQKVDVAYQVVDASQLTTSNNDDGTVNKSYPQELQPRDRSRAASQNQINDIAANINPALLGDSATTVDGAPVVSSDGVVESGNGRTNAIKKAYAQDGQSAADYRAWLTEQGYNTEGMQNPVLVRVRTSEMTPKERLNYVKSSNERTTLAMSSTEQAKSDANQIGDILDLYKGGDINSAENRDFVRNYLKTVVGQGDMASMMDSQGMLSQDGRRRIQATLMAAAYDDAGVVGEMFESMDTDIKSIGDALMDVAGNWAQMRSSAKAGALADGIDVTENLMEAVNLIKKARSEGVSVADLIAQNDMFAGDMNPLTEGFVRLFFRGDNFRRPRSKKDVIDYLNFYAERAMSTQPDAGLFGDEVGAQQIMEAMNGRQEESTAGTDGNAGNTQQGSEPGRRSQPKTVRKETQEGTGSGEDFTLNAQTEAELQAQADNLKAAEEKVAADQKAIDDKAKADLELDDFNLSGSNAPADIAESRGQNSLFDAKPDNVEEISKASNNTIFTDDAAEKARALLRKKLGQMNSGLDPEIMQAGITLAGYHIEKGARSFSAYAKAMVDDLGQVVKPYLKSWYMAAKYDPRTADFNGMDDAVTVDSADIEQVLQEESPNDERIPGNQEPTSATDAEPGTQRNTSDAGRGRSGSGTNQAGAETSGPGRPSESMDNSGTTATGKPSNKPVRSEKSKLEESAARSADDERSIEDSTGGLFADKESAEQISESAAKAPTKNPELNKGALRTVDSGNLDQIKKQMPFLSNGQIEDVKFIEDRFSKPDGYGVLLTNGTGTGKAQPLHSKILTPTGWTTMGEIKPGDKVISVDGKAVDVLSIHPQGKKPIFKVSFSDGSVAETCDEHLWATNTQKERRRACKRGGLDTAIPVIRSLSEIAKTIGENHFIPMVSPVEFKGNNEALPVPHYTMGVLLGDGCFRSGALSISNPDKEIIDRVKSDLPDTLTLTDRKTINRCETYGLTNLGDGNVKRDLANIGLDHVSSESKFIPDCYLYSSIKNRIALLQGLLDTDGTADKGNSTYYTTVSKSLKDGVIELVQSLGGTAKLSTKIPSYTYKGEKRKGQLAYTLNINLPNEIKPFSLIRKAARISDRKWGVVRRKIVSVEYVGDMESQCISVDHESHLYVTDNYLVTHNTFSGLGAVKRLHASGKKNILIVVPKQTIADAWKKAGAKFFDLEINGLENTRDAGKGIVVTTFANFGANDSIYTREWDAFVMDEAQYLSSDAKGSETAALETLKGLSYKRGVARNRIYALNRDDVNKMNSLFEQASAAIRSDNEQEWPLAKKAKDEANQIEAKLRTLIDAEKARIEKIKPEDKPRALFLSATPFAYEKNIVWANQFLFDWGESEGGASYNEPQGFAKFMVQHFGYRMRYNKLTEPDAKVDRSLMQRAFNKYLRDQKVLSSKLLDSDFDYDRKFILTENAIGTQVDQALEWLREKGRGGSGDPKEIDGFRGLSEIINGTFDYQTRMYFLEAIKARESVPYIKANLDLGRNVMILHDFKKGGAVNPFIVSANDADIQAAYSQFANQFRGLINSFDSLLSPVDFFQQEFPSIMIYNGDVTPKNRLKIEAEFNSDEPGTSKLMLAQGDAMREGVSIHDTTGINPRITFNLGMPGKPTAAIQQEGRTFRTGQASDTMFRYFTIGTNWERFAFASKIASRAGAAENLALGDEARGLKESFIAAYEDAGDFMPGFEGEGTGGKATDRSYAQTLTPWDMAKSYYYGTKKQGSGRGARGREQSEFFATPEPIGLKMVQFADIKPGEDTLEPSAGHGAIARWMPEDANNRAIELTSDLASQLALRFNGDLMTGDFMEHNVVNKYDTIVMNPPFGSGGKQAAEHVGKAMRHLRDGGRIVALIPTGPAADKQFDKLLNSEDSPKNIHVSAEIKLPASVFERAGTKVMTRIIVLDRQDDVKKAANIRETNIDYSRYESNDDLFDSIQNTVINPRTESSRPEAKAMPEKAVKNAPTAEDTGGFNTWEAEHTKTGEPLFMVTAKDRVEKDQFRSMAAIAKANNGYWSRFGKAGFLFNTDYDRQAFIAAMGAVNENKLSILDDIGTAAANLIGSVQSDNAPSNSVEQATSKLRASQVGVFVDELIATGNLKIIKSAPKAIVDRMGESAKLVSGYANQDGTITLIADNVVSMDGTKLSNVLLHEGFHAIAPSVLGGKKWDALQGRLERVLSAQEKKLAAGNLELNSDWKRALSRVLNALEQDPYLRGDRQSQIEEFGAYAIEHYDKAPAGIKEWVRNFIDLVKDFMFRRYGIQVGKISEGQLRKMAVGVLRTRATANRPTAMNSIQEQVENSAAEENQQAEVDGLDMSEEAIKARGKEIGFDMDTTYWHGTPDARPIWADGFADRFAGIQGDNAVFFFSSDKRIADTYADDRRAFDYQNAEPQTIPVRLKMTNPKRLNWKGRSFRGRDADGVGFALSEAIDQAKAEGHDSVIVSNIKDTYDGRGKPGNVTVVFDASQIRSVNAAFNPDYADQNNLLLNVQQSEATEYQRAIAKGLDMSESARMKRAKDMGFNTDVVMYHGTGAPRIDAFESSTVGNLGAGIYFTPDPKNASSRSVIAKFKKRGSGFNANVVPVYLKDNLNLLELNENPLSADADYVASQGYDGIARYENGNLIEVNIFDPANIRSINAAFDQDNADQNNIMMSIQETTSGPQSAVEGDILGPMEGRFIMPDETRGEGLQRIIQDRFNRVKKALDIVASEGGTVTEASNVYKAEERFHGRSTAKIEDLMDKELKPFIDEVAASDMTLDEVSEYAYAKHARERNAYIGSINDKFQNGGGSGMSDQESDAIIAAIEEKYGDKVKSIHKKLMAISDGTRKYLLKEGLISAAEAEAWSEMFNNYVPLKGFENVDEYGNVVKQSGRQNYKGFSVSGRESKAATGRQSRAAQLIENIVAQREQAIIRAEKNRVAKSMLRLVLDNPDPTLWSVNEVKSKAKITGDDGRKAITDIFSDRPANAPIKKDKKVVYVPVMNRYGNDVITAKVNGREVLITIKDPIMAEQMRMSTATALPPGFAQLNIVNRALAQLWTALNPVFTVTNYSRDIQTAVINAMGEDKNSKGLASKTLKYALPGGFAMRASTQHLKGKDTEGAEWYERYRQAGGKTGFYSFDSIEDKSKELQRLIDAAKGERNKALVAKDFVVDTLMTANAIIENTPRLAAFRAGVESGMSDAEAASFAKNLTVNFNRRGEWTHFFGSLYLFFNPAVQGITRMGQAIKKSPKVQGAITALAMGTLGLALINREMGGDDEDGEPFYDKLPNYVKMRNLVIMKPDGSGDYFKIPMPYGYSFFSSIGNAVYDYGFSNKSKGQTAGDLAQAFAMSFNPVGDGAPTVLAPWIQLELNKNFFGSQIMPPQPPYGSPIPDSERYYPSMKGGWLQEATTALNSVTGGNEARPGWVDISPESIDHIFRSYMGGLGASASDILKVATQDDTELTRLPFAKQVYGTQFKGRAVNKFYENAQEADISNTEGEMVYASENEKKIREWIDNKQWQANMDSFAKDVRQELSGLRKQMREAKADPSLDKAEKSRIIKEIESQMESVAVGFNREWNNQRREANK